MLIAHLPSGYLLSGLFKTRTQKAAALIGSVLPDIDMFYFYLIDNKQTLHHDYWFHMPWFWLSVIALMLGVNTVSSKNKLPLIKAFGAGLLLHLILDSVTGHIQWLAPFSSHPFQMIIVPATQSHWILSYIFHWSFIFEIGIVITAILIAVFRLKSKNHA